MTPKAPCRWRCSQKKNRQRCRRQKIQETEPSHGSEKFTQGHLTDMGGDSGSPVIHSLIEQLLWEACYLAQAGLSPFSLTVTMHWVTDGHWTCPCQGKFLSTIRYNLVSNPLVSTKRVSVVQGGKHQALCGSGINYSTGTKSLCSYHMAPRGSWAVVKITKKKTRR